jgi:hypothetical protein
MSFLIDPIVHLKPYTEKEFVEIAVKVLDREEDIEKDGTTFIAESVFSKLKSTNIRQCVRIARSAGNDISNVRVIVAAFQKSTTEM